MRKKIATINQNYLISSVI